MTGNDKLTTHLQSRYDLKGCINRYAWLVAPCDRRRRPPPSGTAARGAGKLDRARSRLYRGQILQVNMRLKALAEIYTMHSFAQL